MITPILLLLTLLHYSSASEDCVLACDDQWWTSYMDAWLHCDYDKIMEQYPTPLDRECVNTLVGDGNKIISCLEDQKCFTHGQEWCESYTCDFYQCERYNLCYTKQEHLCDEEWEKCFQKCEEEHPNEEPDCVEQFCFQSMEGCLNQETCAVVLHHVQEDNLCDDHTNGGHSCFDDVYQHKLCTNMSERYAHTSATTECTSKFKDLAVCFEEHCYETPAVVAGEEHWEPYDYYYHTGTDDYHSDGSGMDHPYYYYDYGTGSVDTGLPTDECHCDCSMCGTQQSLQQSRARVRPRMRTRSNHRRVLRRKPVGMQSLQRKRYLGRGVRGARYRRRLGVDDDHDHEHVHGSGGDDGEHRHPGPPDGPQYGRRVFGRARERFSAVRKRKFQLSARIMEGKK